MNKEPCKVLVVDEDRDNADTTMMLLQMWGHEAAAVYSAEDAISAATTLDPDVVLMDLGRPIVNGFDLADDLRRHCPTAKFVAITTFTAADIVPRTRNAGFDKVLFKPTPARELKKAIDTECVATSLEK